MEGLVLWAHMKSVVYIDNESEIDSYLLYIKDNPPGNHVCIAANAPTWYSLHTKGVKSIALTHYQELKELHGAWKIAVDMSSSWFMDKNEKDLTEFDGVSLGKSLKYSTSLFFTYTLKAIDHIHNILEKEKPDAVLLVENSKNVDKMSVPLEIPVYKNIFKYLALRGKYKVESIPSGDAFLEKNEKKIFKIKKYFLFFLKKIYINLVDSVKDLCDFRLCHGHAQVRTLVIGATDLSYIGYEVIKKYLGNSKRTLFYLDHEMNCYLNMGLRYVKKNRPFKGKDERNEQKIFSETLEGNQLKNSILTSNDKLTYRGVPLFPLCREYFDFLFEKEMPALLGFLERAKHALQLCRANICLITNYQMPNSLLLAQLAARNNIPVLHIPHGHNYGYIRQGEIHTNDWIDFNNITTYGLHEAVGLKLNYRLLKKYGIKKDKLVLTGIPYSETVASNCGNEKMKARYRLGFSEEETVLLLGTHIINKFLDKICNATLFDSFDYLNLYEKLLKIAANEPGIRLAFKFRPGDCLLDPTIDMVFRMGLKNVSFFTRDLRYLLLAADAVLVSASNIGLEALYYDLPVLQYYLPRTKNTLPLSREGAAIEIKDINDLPGILYKIKSNKKFREERITAQRMFLENNLPGDNESASERIVKLIEKLALK